MALTLVAAMASCTRELDSPQGVNGQVSEVEMSVSLPDAAVRTALGQRGENSYQTIWCEGDQLSMNGLMSIPLTADNAGRNVAKFKFKGNLTFPYNLLYPATEDASTVRFPSVQKYVEGTFDPMAVPMYSSSKSFENATLHHLSSLLKFTFTSQQPVNLSLIQVTAMGGEHLSGDFALVADADGLLIGELVAKEGSVSTSLSCCEEGCPLSADPRSFYLSIPHGTYSKGFNVLVITDDDKVMTLRFYTKDGEKTIEPSRVIEFETVQFESESDAVLLIRNEADLQALETSQDGYSEAVLIADLDFSGKEWTPVQEISLTLNGAGHKIKGLPSVLCRRLTGTIKDLTIDADINMTEGVMAAAFAEQLNGEGASLETCVSEGQIVLSNSSASGKAALAGLAVQVDAGAKLINCSNRATVKAASSLKGLTALSQGGCVAIMNGSMDNVVNYGDVIVESGSGLSSYLLVGGVMAEGLSGTLKGVVNAGKVDVARYSSLANGNRIGGVIGKNKFTSLDHTMISNTSESEVDYTITGEVTNPAVGGLLGMTETPQTTLSSLINNGALNVTVSASGVIKEDAKFGGIVGYFYSGTASHLKCEDCKNLGDITISGKLTSSSKLMEKGVQIGGIMGRCQITGSTDDVLAEITSCTNLGDITLDNADGSLYTFVGGINGVHSVMKTQLSDCENTGNIVINGGLSGTVFMGGITGSVYRAANSNSIYSNCTNAGRIALYDASSTNEVAAGGIIGNASGIKDKAMTLRVENCSNAGAIDRLTTKNSNSCNSYAGGIIGVVGRRHQTTKEGYVTVALKDCANSADIIFNQFTGFDTFSEQNQNYSFTGGIIGCSLAENGAVEVVCCSNSGNMLSTSGQHAGIVGFAHSSTAVKGQRKSDGTVQYTVNTGNICELPSLSTGSSYCIAGGIVGYMKSHATKINTIEYACNSGNVCASFSSDEESSAGGIVGKHQASAVVRYCKNSGKVSNIKDKHCGAISGGNMNMTVEYCGVGGQVLRSSGWIILDDGGTYPWQNYIYRNDILLASDGSMHPDYPSERYYKGCCFWDGKSELPWEKSDWVEPEE